MTDREAFEAWFNDWHDPNIGMIEVSVERTAGWHAWQAATLAERERAAKAMAVLQFFANIDLTTSDVPANFAWYVLEARAIRKGETE